MKSLNTVLPKLSYTLFAAFLLSMAWRSHNDTTVALVLSAVLMFAFCWTSAIHLMGNLAALKFIVIAVSFGWFAEQMGASRGWFFGSYHYTEVLGWQLGDVPVIIPLMWFALCYVGYVISNFIVWQKPVLASAGTPNIPNPPGMLLTLAMSFLAAMIVTAYDLGADPYMVFTLKAWIMTKTDGGWFGETLQGFFGWMLVSFMIIFCFQLTTRKHLQATPPAPVTATATDIDIDTDTETDTGKWQALLPLSIYACSMVFQAYFGNPVETRIIALFAMGIPLLCAYAGWRRWQPVPSSALSAVSDARLEQMQYLADPLADNTIATLLGPWSVPVTLANQSMHWQKICLVNQQFDQWQTNQNLQAWQPADPALPDDIRLPLQAYLQAGQVLPVWADSSKIERAEKLFMEYGALSCSLLFCSSLPECYVIPDLSAVLQVAGQLEKHTEYRIRATAAMIFPVMLKGGLCSNSGSAVAQILKVRLIHATIRNLILRGSPDQAMRLLGEQRHVAGAGVLPALPTPHTSHTDSMQQALFAHGWKLGEDGLPCNQEELAYTLLTFGYIFLRSLRTLGLGLSAADEEAYLHTWNVVGHLLGIRRELLVDTMPQAAALFAQMQARGRAEPVLPDPRPSLSQALMTTMEQAIPFRLLKPFPVLLTRYLCGAANARDIGVDGRVSWLSRGVFTLFMLTTRMVDSAVRFVLPEFSLSRLITRVLGYHFMSKILLDQTRPLKLPTHLINSVNNTMESWSQDPKAPRWINNIEDKLTTSGKWNASKTSATTKSQQSNGKITSSTI
ncbi:hypothetical protein BH11PSE12_BH11PSE12_19900 [soil metagenome]